MSFVFVLFFSVSDDRLMDRWVPSSWQETLTAFKEAAVYGDDCKKQFACATN